MPFKFIQLKDDINIIFIQLINIITWKHLESFHKRTISLLYRGEHQGMGEQTRQFRSAIKVKLIK